MADPSALACPNCGAPLPAAASGTVLCIYCNSAVRLPAGGEGGAPVVEHSLDEAQMAHLKQHILDGKRTQAAAEYRQLTGASQADASHTVEELEDRLSANIVLHQQLSPFGWILLVGSVLILLGTAYTYFAGRLNPWFAALMAILCLANIAIYFRSLRISLEFLGAPVAQATVIKLAPVGEVKSGRRTIHTFKFLVEVQPKDAPAFQAELLLPVRQKSLERLKPGLELKVKYLRRNPQRLVYQR